MKPLVWAAPAVALGLIAGALIATGAFDAAPEGARTPHADRQETAGGEPMRSPWERGTAAPAAAPERPGAGPPAPTAAGGGSGVAEPAPSPAELAEPGAATPVWPAAGAARAAAAGAAAGEPDVPIELAFRALWYVGVDPEAERTWIRAIQDPKMPPGVRSDLIEDLNDEGYSDNSHPTEEDLPLILARLRLIERLAPYAIDEVNRAAFEEAYKDLLEMYLRLGGKLR